MKHLYQYLTESKYDDNFGAIINDIKKMKFWKECGCFENPNWAPICFPPDCKCPDELVKFLNKLKHEHPRGLQSIYGSFWRKESVPSPNGYVEIGGYVRFTGMNNVPDRHVDANWNLYHVCPGKYVDSIKKTGLQAREMEFANNSDIKNEKYKFSFEVFCYKALFGVWRWQDCKKVVKDLGIQDPHMVKFKPGKTTWYTDELMNIDARNGVTSSVYTYEDIPANQIIDIKRL